MVDEARRLLGEQGRGTILFLDEVHRFNRSQQDALLPSVEEGLIVLIGATTENPFFQVNAPLLSRSTLWRLEPLSRRGAGRGGGPGPARPKGPRPTPEAVAALVGLADGDARAVLTTLEVALALAGDAPGDRSTTWSGPATPDSSTTARTTTTTRSARSSSRSAAPTPTPASTGWPGCWSPGRTPVSSPGVWSSWPARTSARPTRWPWWWPTLPPGPSSSWACPEAQLNLAQAVVHLACAPKSNRVTVALGRAQRDVREGPRGDVPAHLRDAHYRSAAAIGHGEGYVYPHDEPGGLGRPAVPAGRAGGRRVLRAERPGPRGGGGRAAPDSGGPAGRTPPAPGDHIGHGGRPRLTAAVPVGARHRPDCAPCNEVERRLGARMDGPAWPWRAPWEPVGSAVAATPAAATQAQVRLGGTLARSLPAATWSAPPPEPRRSTIDVSLQPRDPAALDAFVQAVSAPGSPEYHHYLAAGQFGAVFGPTPATIATTRAWLGTTGLQVGPTTSDGLLIPVSGTAAQVERAFDVPLIDARLPSGRIARYNTVAPLVPAAVSAQLQSVIGLSTVAQPHAQIVPGPRAVNGSTGSSGSSGSATSPRPTGATAHLRPGGVVRRGDRPTIPGAYTADQLASTYGFDSLYGAGKTGAGVTVAIYELEPYTLADIQGTPAATASPWAPIRSPRSRRRWGHRPPVGRGGPRHRGRRSAWPRGPPSTSTRDPTATCRCGNGPIDTYSAMVNDDSAQVITTSWGECEPLMATSPGEQSAETTLFAQAAVQGQTVVAAAGDSGSSDCYYPGVDGDTSLPVDDPADQPVRHRGGGHLAAVGGHQPRRDGVERRSGRRRRRWRGVVRLHPAGLAVRHRGGRPRRHRPVHGGRTAQLPRGTGCLRLGRPGPWFHHVQRPTRRPVRRLVQHRRDQRRLTAVGGAADRRRPGPSALPRFRQSQPVLVRQQPERPPRRDRRDQRHLLQLATTRPPVGTTWPPGGARPTHPRC